MTVLLNEIEQKKLSTLMDRLRWILDVLLNSGASVSVCKVRNTLSSGFKIFAQCTDGKTLHIVRRGLRNRGTGKNTGRGPCAVDQLAQESNTQAYPIQGSTKAEKLTFRTPDI